MNKFIILIFGIFWINSVNATSCGVLKDDFYIFCENGHCKGEFRVRQIPSSVQMCARRIIVETISDDLINLIIEKTPEKMKVNSLNGYFHIIVYHRFNYNKKSNIDDLRKSFNNLNARVSLFEEVSKNIDLLRVKSNSQEIEKEKLQIEYIIIFFLYVIFVIIMISIYKSVRTYWNQVNLFFEKKAKLISFFEQLILQLVLLFIFLLLLQDFRIHFVSELKNTLIVFTIVFILILEIFLFFVLWFRKQKINIKE